MVRKCQNKKWYPDQQTYPVSSLQSYIHIVDGVELQSSVVYDNWPQLYSLHLSISLLSNPLKLHATLAATVTCLHISTLSPNHTSLRFCRKAHHRNPIFKLHVFSSRIKSKSSHKEGFPLVVMDEYLSLKDLTSSGIIRSWIEFTTLRFGTSGDFYHGRFLWSCIWHPLRE